MRSPQERRTKIVITIGPASDDEKTIERLIQTGVNVVRLNFSHGTHAEHLARIKRLRTISQRLERPITILQDLQGPKIRTGRLAKGSITLVNDQVFYLTGEPVLGDEHQVSVDFPGVDEYLQPGNRILLDDGKLELVVEALEGRRIKTRVAVGGELTSHKGVNLPGIKLEIPSLTEKDEADLAFGLKHEVDAIALSFVRSQMDIVQLRETISNLSPHLANTPVIAKLEKAEALENLDKILDAADGVMVARGDLGVEMSPEEVPIAQKQIIEAANIHAKVVITATQMLDSMIHNPRPTRAEASDVANAIFDGTDAVMLSGETAVGKYPVESVQIMDAIIRKAEDRINRWGHWRGEFRETPFLGVSTGETTHDDALSITRAARELAHDRNVAAIAVFTQTGRTAQLMAKARPRTPILAFTPITSTYRRLPLLWGVIPHLVPYADTLEAMLMEVEKAIMTATPITPGSQVVLISGFPVGALCPPNMALLYTLGSFHKSGA